MDQCRIKGILWHVLKEVSYVLFNYISIAGRDDHTGLR
ncbi:hypothetical protein LAJLEIBI_02958 [[Clostridium] hylemonae DSM 15053]|nr:hypothetical protein LAJLEIBI_02958 [[Clostridium] hylemonae DSM 15053]